MLSRHLRAVASCVTALLVVCGVFSLGAAQEVKKEVKSEKKELKKEFEPDIAKVLKELQDIGAKMERLEVRLKALEDFQKPALPLPVGKAGKVPGLAAPGGQIRGTGLKIRDRPQYRAAVQKLLQSRPLRASISVRSIVVAAAPPENFDVRKEFQKRYPNNKIRFAVQDQSTCGSCWDFAAVAAFEANFALKSGQEAFPSEQFILNCCAEQSGDDRADCGGGYLNVPLQFLVDKGTPSRTTAPYLDDPARAEPCNLAIQAVYFATAIGAVEGPNHGIPDKTEIQRQVMDRGAVLVTMLVNRKFQRLGLIDPCPDDFVWNEQVQPEHDALGRIINGHAVAIIGWDNAKGAWLIKNSWSPQWGHKADFGDEGGYLWVQYGKARIAEEVWYVEAKTPPVIATKDAPVITSTLSASAIPGVAFSYQITATNTPTTFSAAGLPHGLAVNVNTGLISGIPCAVGTFAITLGATNAHGTGNATLTLSVGTAAPPVPAIIPNYNANVLEAIDYWTKLGYPPPAPK